MHLIEGIDWAQKWRQREKVRKEPDDSSYWDGRATHFASKTGRSDYAATFIEYLGNPQDKTIMDMGAGAGTLAVPLALAGNKVLACDFSPKMLDGALAVAAEQQISAENLETKLLAWADDWHNAGITDKSFDYVIASRSTMVADLAEALDKLDRTARERVAMTVSTEFAPRGTYELGKPHMGQDKYVPDQIYAINILFAMGAYPQLRYINSYKKDSNGQRQRITWAFITWEPVTN